MEMVFRQAYLNDSIKIRHTLKIPPSKSFIPSVYEDLFAFIDFGTEFVLDVRLVAEFKHTPGEGVTSRLVPGDDERSRCDNRDGVMKE
jgi:hypothetical protein